MKNLKLYCLLLAAIGLTSCKNKDLEKAPAVIEVGAPINVACYEALYEQDTLNLKINTFKNGEIKGDMVMVIYNIPKKIGIIEGEFRGDTLFVDYTFTENKFKRKTFKNPMAFLKRDNQLILGNGKIETTMGHSYFIKGEAIDFDSVKYKLNVVECETKE
jgi:hypothetical protein